MSGPLRRLILRQALTKRPIGAARCIRAFSTEEPPVSPKSEGLDVLEGVEPPVKPKTAYNFENLEADLEGTLRADDDLKNVASALGSDISAEVSSEIEDMINYVEQQDGGLVEAKQASTIDDEWGRSYATGRRKTASARVWIFPGPGRVTVNHKSLIDYFVRDASIRMMLKPFELTETTGKYDVWCTVKGGGLSAQAGAIRLGISRALNQYQPELRSLLKSEGFLTRDARKVEKKKPGQPKARKKKQWVKR